MGACHHLLLYRLDDLRMRMAEKQCAMAAEVVHVLVAVDIPFARAGRARHVNRVGLSRSGIVRQPGRQHTASFFEQPR